jgi:hypothetical protein
LEAVGVGFGEVFFELEEERSFAATPAAEECEGIAVFQRPDDAFADFLVADEEPSGLGTVVWIHDFATTPSGLDAAEVAGFE